MNPLNHVAIIMDGNGRWGKKNKNSRNSGHRQGLKAIEKIIKQTIKRKIWNIYHKKMARQKHEGKGGGWETQFLSR